MDPLQDVLHVAGVTSHLSTSLEAGGAWAVCFDPPGDFGIKFNAVTRGRARIEVRGEPPTDLGAGDCFLLTRSRPFVLRDVNRDDPKQVEAHTIFANTRVARAGRGDETRIIGGRFAFGGHSAARRLLDDLPPIIHVPAGSEQAGVIAWALAQIDAELTGALGGDLVAEHLAMVMFVHVLRVHLAARPASGWLGAMSDPVAAAALRAMHEHPEHPWTVGELAHASAVSRSTLAARFTRTVGRSPLDYLTGWRIELAADRLRTTDSTLATIAQAVGYGSESALSTAFKRVRGTSPAAYRRELSA